MLSRALLAISESDTVEQLARHELLSRRLVRRFVAGDRINDAVDAARALADDGIGAILDLLGEGVRDREGAQTAAAAYRAALTEIGRHGLRATISVKPSQLGLHVDRKLCVEHLLMLCSAAADASSSVEIDIEGSDDVDASIEVYRAAQASHPETRLALQAYLRRTPNDLDDLRDLAPRIRLVKGAYAEPPSIAFQHRSEIDEQYVFLADWLCRHGSAPAFGTHDHRLIDRIRPLLDGHGVSEWEIQMLYGVRRDHQRRIAADGFPLRVYIPYGDAWYPYLTRRLAERPANLLFFLRAAAGR
jgi:proline dehydrogenase